MTKAVYDSNFENGINMGVKKMKFEVTYTSRETFEKGEKEKIWVYETSYTTCHLEYLLEEFANFCIEERLHDINVKDTNFWDVKDGDDTRPEVI